MSQEEVAKIMGISQNYYSYIESGDRQKDLNLSIVHELSKALGLTVEQILEEETKISKLQMQDLKGEMCK